LEYIFKHALIQEVAYNSLLQSRRKEIHERIGEAIESLYASGLEEFYEMLAYHYSKSENHEKAYQYLKLSGKKAWGNYSDTESYNFYRQAIDKLKYLPDTEENKKAQVEITVNISNPMPRLAFPPGSLKILEQGIYLAKNLGDEVSEANFYSRISTYYAYKGEVNLGLEYAENSFTKAMETQDIELIVHSADGLIDSYLVFGEMFKLVDTIPKVVTLLENKRKKSDTFGRSTNKYAYFCATLGASMGYLGYFTEGESFIEKGLNSATIIENFHAMGISEQCYGLLYAIKGDGSRTISHMQQSIKYHEEVDYAFIIGLLWSGLGYGYYLIGDLKTAQTYIEKGLKLFSDSSSTIFQSMAFCHLSITYCDSNDITDAQICAEKAVKLSQQNHEKHFMGFSQIVLGRILGRITPLESDKAEASILQGMKILTELKLNPFLAHGHFFLGELYANSDRKEEALKDLNKAMAMCKEMGMGFWPDKIQEVLDRL